MSAIWKLLLTLLIATYQVLQVIWTPVRRLLNRKGELSILPYRGLGTPERILVRGRVLHSPTARPHQDGDGHWRNLANMVRRINTVESPGQLVRVSVAGQTVESVSDAEGFFQVEVLAGAARFNAPLQDVEITAGTARAEVRTQTEAVVSTPESQRLIISDIDDTVIHTGATNLLTMAWSTLFGTAASRTAFGGVAAFYQQLVRGKSGRAGNPLVFISRSPWNLYDLFDHFCELQGMPAGRVFFLRDWGISREGLTPAKTRGHKYGLIREILDVVPHLPVVLLGDSGQKDPEIYTAIASEYPTRVQGIFIRDVTNTERRRAEIDELAAALLPEHISLCLSKDSAGMAVEAAARGWISTPDPAERD